MDTTLPALFISHGAPSIALQAGATGAFWQRLSAQWTRQFGRPRAIVAVSAHTLARVPTLLGASRHAAVYDFGGFPAALYRLRYDAPGEPRLAAEVQGLLHAAGIEAQTVDQGGLDHGIWTPLRTLFADAQVPVLPLAWVPSQSPQQQMALGQALAPLRARGVLVLATGSMTHNLQRVFAQGLDRPERPASAEIPESAAFRRWWAQRSELADWPALLEYRRLAPHATDMHPSNEHLLPWFIAAGAGGRESIPQRLYEGVTHGCLGMDVYAFGREAQRLVLPGATVA